MNREELLDKVSDIIREISMGNVVEVKGRDNLYSDLHIDSMAAVELAFAVEEEFEIGLSDEELNQIKTVNDFIDLVIDKAA